MKQLLIAVLLITCIPIYTRPQGKVVAIAGGFLRGSDYLKMDTIEQRAYAIGVINGMTTAVLFDAPKEKVAWLENCVVEMTDVQVAAILTKHLRDNPAEWHRGMNVLSFNAMITACPRAK